MTTTITGIGSGFDIDSWVSSLVSAKKQSTVAPLETKLSTLNSKNSALLSLKSKCSSLLSNLQTFTKTIYNSQSDMWTNTKIESSNSSYATAISSGNVAAADVKLRIEQIATATTARSLKSIGANNLSEEEYIQSIKDTKFTNLANGQAKTGTFSLFLDGEEFNIRIAKDDTLGDVMDKISDATKGRIQAEIDGNGNFSINAYNQKLDENGKPMTEQVDTGKVDEEGNPILKTVYLTDGVNQKANLSIGSGADTSNFAAALKLHEANVFAEGDNKYNYGYSSSYVISTVYTSAAMASSESGISGIKFFDLETNEEATSGKIKINGVEFNVDENTTLEGLISQINGNSDANVQASYDSLTNKLILTSTETGQSNISLAEEGTNLLNVLGLTEYSYDSEGNITGEKLASGSQELGQNAIVYVNGNKVISTSNTITGESSGISNLSITVKKPTSEWSGDNEDEKEITLDIQPDYTKVKESLEGFVNAYNDLIGTIRTATSSSGEIGMDSTLSNLASQLKSIVSGVAQNDGMYNLLSQIGISTSSSDITKLSIDNTKLEKALSENLYSVKQLLSDGYTSKDDNGLFDKMANVLTQITDSTNGYFSTLSNSINSQISSLNTRIERANTSLSKYQIRITNQFNKMDSVLASLNTQLSAFQSYFG